jgi:hypothetical protein
VGSDDDSGHTAGPATIQGKPSLRKLIMGF